MSSYKVTFWGWESRYLGETYCDSLAEAKKEARIRGKYHNDALTATIKTPRGKFHHVRLP